MYLTYLEYKSMGGTLDETTFNNFEFEAECVVDWYTFGRLKKFTEYPQALKKCMFSIIKMIEQQANLINTGMGAGTSETGISSAIASQSNDGVSISYNMLSAKDILDIIKAQVESTIKMYLSYVTDSLGRKILYRGIYPNE